MKSLNGVAAVAAWSGLAIGGGAVAQDAVQWRVEDGGNGHWYDHTFAPFPIGLELCGLDWYVDFAAAYGAYPVTITSAEEEAHVLEVLPYFNGTYSVAVMGLYRESPTHPWVWVNGEPFAYSNFIGGSSNGLTAHLYDEQSEFGPGWRRALNCYPVVYQDAFGGGGVSVILEWSADCNGDGIVDYGQILDGTLADANENGVPDCCEGGSPCGEEIPTVPAAKLALGNSFAVAITVDGEVVAWGDNSQGATNVPDGIVNPVRVAAWDHHALVLQADGRVIAWGGNTYGQTNVPTDLPPAIGIAPLSRGSLALHPDGTASGWGQNYWCGAGTGTLDIPEGVVIREISGGNAHWLYRSDDDTVAGRGCNFNGQWNVPSAAQPPLEFEANESWSCVLGPTGEIFAMGWGGYGRLDTPPGNDFVDIACGHYFGLGLRSNGVITPWGSNSHGQGSIPAGLADVVALEAGSTYAAVVHGDGTLTMWGNNDSGQCDWPTEIRVSVDDPDCDGDGIPDWKAILEGSASDLNANGIPDQCEEIDFVVTVPGDFNTIQSAIDASADGWTIQVAPGVYYEQLAIGDRQIVVEAVAGLGKTVIDGTGLPGSVVTMISAPDASEGGPTLRGFTIRGGTFGTQIADTNIFGGGGLYLEYGSPTIDSCFIVDNSAPLGGGLYTYYGSPTIVDSSLVSNIATVGDGGGLQLFRADAVVQSCILEANFSVGQGAGVHAARGSSSLLNCQVTSNEAIGTGAGVSYFAVEDSSLVISGCSIESNVTQSLGAGLWIRPGFDNAFIENSIICGNEPDEIFGDFTDLGGNELCICIADITGNGIVNGADLAEVLGGWGPCDGSGCTADLNGDGTVGGADLAVLLGNWGPCP